MVQAGITEVVYYDDKYPDQDIFKAAKIVMDKVGIKYRKFQPSGINIDIKL
jgi:dCMP deaminase